MSRLLEFFTPASEVQVIIYDMDGLLVDTEPIAAQAARATLAQFDLQITAEDEERFIGKAWPAILAIIRERNRIPFDSDVLRETIKKRYEELIERDLPVLPGAVESVKTMGNHYPLGLVSGSTRAQIDRVLTKLGIGNAFSAKFGIDDYGVSKPAPDGFLRCAQNLGVLPQACLVLEDSQPGVAAAKAAGMKVIGVAAGNHSGQDLSAADAQIATLTELIDLLTDLQ